MKYFLTSCFTSIVFISFSQQQTPSTIESKDSTKAQFVNFIKEVQVIRAETKSEIQELKNSLSTNNTSSQSEIQKLKDKTEHLEKEVESLKKIEELQVSAKNGILLKRYDLATKIILPEIMDGVIYVKGLSKFLMIEQNINITTSVWQDKDIRGGYDKVKDFTPIFGVVGAGLPLLSKDANPKTALLTGIGAMLIPQVISWIGKSNSKVESSAEKIKNKIEFLNISRRAHDELYQRKLEITNIYKKDSLFQAELESFKKSIEKKTVLSDSARNIAIFQVQDFLTKFMEIQSQIPTYLKWTKDIVSKYKTFPDIYMQLKNITDDIDSFLVGFYKDFDTLASIPLEVRKELFMSQ